MTAHPAISLHIEELVLHGVNPADGHRIGEAVVRELIRLLGAGDSSSAFSHDLSVDRLPGRSHALPCPEPAVIGNQIARAVHEGLGR